MNPNPEEVGRRLRHLRLAWNFSKQVAWVKFLGEPITTSQWNNWEKAQSIPDMIRARHVAMKAKVTTDWIWWGDRAGLPVSMALLLDEVERAEAEAAGGSAANRA